MRTLLMVDNPSWAQPETPWRPLAEGLGAIGLDVDVLALHNGWPPYRGWYDVVFIWNDLKGVRKRIAEYVRSQGAIAMVLERGFFDRVNYTQIDHRGFSQYASWTDCLGRPAPEEGERRFLQVWGDHPRPVHPRSGYVLILSQRPHDAQYQDAEFDHPGPFIEAVCDAAPLGADVRVRWHPASGWRCERPGPVEAKAAGTLAEDVEGAAFVVTINSKSGTEALALGCPVVCVGPALYSMAGVARRMTAAGMSRAIGEMLDGWSPDPAAVANYLYWLVCRQYSRAELARGDVLESILTEAVGQAAGQTVGQKT